jgi:hypothetical protein
LTVEGGTGPHPSGILLQGASCGRAGWVPEAGQEAQGPWAAPWARHLLTRGALVTSPWCAVRYPAVRVLLGGVPASWARNNRTDCAPQLPSGKPVTRETLIPLAPPCGARAGGSRNGSKERRILEALTPP